MLIARGREHRVNRRVLVLLHWKQRAVSELAKDGCDFSVQINTAHGADELTEVERSIVLPVWRRTTGDKCGAKRIDGSLQLTEIDVAKCALVMSGRQLRALRTFPDQVFEQAKRRNNEFGDARLFEMERLDPQVLGTMKRRATPLETSHEVLLIGRSPRDSTKPLGLRGHDDWESA